MNREQLIIELRGLIEQTLELDEPLSVSNDENLFESELELDSIDILELESVIKKKYRLESEKFEKERFSTLESIANYINEYHHNSEPSSE